jgi:sulfur relay (sulfurtransferase) complex TusBCD TusD component (DsrE family)
MAKTLLILNEQPYGGERSYNGLRLAIALLKTQAEEVHVFLIGDGAAARSAYAAPAWTHGASPTPSSSKARSAAPCRSSRNGTNGPTRRSCSDSS